MNRLLLVMLCVALALTACAPLAPTAAPPPALPDETQPPAAEAPTAPPSAPGETPTPLSILPAVSPTPEPSPTPQLAATLMAGSDPTVLEEAPSPDGQFTARLLRWDCAPLADPGNPGLSAPFAFEQILLLRAGGEPMPAIDSQLIRCEGLGAFGLGNLAWSGNSRFLYYTTAREGSPDGAGCNWSPPLLAYDLAGGQRTVLSQGPVSALGLLAARAGSDLIIWDPENGERGRVPVVDPNRQAILDLAWSPDGTRLAYLVSLPPCIPGDPVELFELEMANPVPRLLASASETFVRLEWPAENDLRLWTADNVEWGYRLAENQLAPR